MSKKINFSIKDREYLEILNISKITGKKAIEIIRERYEKGQKTENFEQKYNEIKLELKLLRKENDIKYTKLMNIFELICEQNVFSNEVLQAILKGSKSDSEISKFYESVSEKSRKIIHNLRVSYAEN